MKISSSLRLAARSAATSLAALPGVLRHDAAEIAKRSGRGPGAKLVARPPGQNRRSAQTVRCSASIGSAAGSSPARGLTAAALQARQVHGFLSSQTPVCALSIGIPS
jgi:hypothetical protein